MALDIIEAILLFSLSIPIVMKYRILPIDGTPYWLFGVLFALLIANCLVVSSRIKNLILSLVLFIVLGGVTVTAMVDRARTAPVYGVHDIILQQEAAMRFVITGKNPYKETDFKTPVETFHYAELGNEKAVNPALYHFVMPPWYLVFPFTFYYTVRPVVGFFDGRMASLFTMVILLFALWHWFKDKAVARLAIILTSLSPAVIDYFVEGRSDVFALSWLVVSLVLLEKKYFVWSAFFLALSVLSKQTIWFVLPFYVAGVPKRQWVKSALMFVTLTLIITLPFFLWDPRAFLDSVICYLNGTSLHSYPVSGYGFGMVLYAAGFIKDIHAYYPFIIWQLIFCVPLFIVLMRSLLKNTTHTSLMFSYAIFLTVFWYFSRYLNNSHLGYISMLFVLAGLKQMDEGRV